MDKKQMQMAEELLFSGKQESSFAKKLFFGLFDSAQVFPYPYLGAEDEVETELLLKKLEEFVEKEVDPDWIDQHRTIPEHVTRALGEMGIMGLTVPKEYGGLGMTQTAYCKATEVLGRRCASTALYVNVHQSVGLKSLILFGNEAQRKKWLEPMARGEKLAAFALTEPEAGSDAGNLQTRAVYDPEKKVYRITGTKQWITHGGIADVLTVMAQTDVETDQGTQQKITAFLVTPDMPGFKVKEKSLDKVGFRGTKTAILEFNEMEVPEENILGKKGEGLKIPLSILNYGRITFGALCTGVGKYLLERAVEHANTRIQFGKPLAEFEMIKRKIALIGAYSYAMESTTYLTAGLLDRGAKDVMLESAMLKVFTSDSLWWMIYETMQIFGGRSFFKTEPFERMMRDARLNMIGEGANEVMRVFIGAVGMRDPGMQLKEVLDALRSPFSGFGALWRLMRIGFFHLKTPEVPVRSPVLQKEAKQLGKAVKHFGNAVAKLLGKYREEIVDRQFQLDRMATAAMAIYSATAVLSRLDSDLFGKGKESEEMAQDLARGKFYIEQAMLTVDCSLMSLNRNNDASFVACADVLTGRS